MSIGQGALNSLTPDQQQQLSQRLSAPTPTTGASTDITNPTSQFDDLQNRAANVFTQQNAALQPQNFVQQLPPEYQSFRVIVQI